MDERPPLCPPPRLVPLPLRLRVMFGGVLPTVAFCLLLIGAPLSLAFVRFSELMTSSSLGGELLSTDGVVETLEPIAFEINHQKVFRVHYRYEVDGQRHHGSAYHEGSLPKPGATVTVEYVPDDPATSRVRGMRTALLPTAIGFTLVLPAVGVLLLVLGWRGNARRAGLLRDGESAWAILTDRAPTSTRVNNQRVYRLTFTFVDADGQRRTVVERSHRNEFFDESKARHVLYDPHSPRACLVDTTPGRPRLAGDEWAAPGAADMLRVLVLPLLTAAATLIALYVLFGAA